MTTIAQLLHQHLWQRLPYRLRRNALFNATAYAAPRPSVGAVATTPLIVAGTFRTTSGLGESARLCHDALRAAGESPVLGLDLSAALKQPSDTEFAITDARGHTGPGTLILHVNAPLVPLAMLRLGRRFLREKYVIGCWAWELPQLPAEWRLGLPFVHEIWAPSHFTAAAVATIAAHRPIRVMPLPVAVRRPPPIPVIDDKPFTVLTFFNAKSSIVRKNPEAAIAAFQQAFGSDPGVRLIVKATHLGDVPQGGHIRALCAAPNIVLEERVTDPGALDALYAQADVVLSLHRSEGFGLTLAEAMLRGLPVVATDWSGSVDFVSEACGIPVPYRLVPAQDPQRTYHFPQARWADPDVPAAAAALVALRADPKRRERLGAAAAAFAAENWSVERYARIVREALSLPSR